MPPTPRVVVVPSPNEARRWPGISRWPLDDIIPCKPPTGGPPQLVTACVHARGPTPADWYLFPGSYEPAEDVTERIPAIIDWARYKQPRVALLAMCPPPSKGPMLIRRPLLHEIQAKCSSVWALTHTSRYKVVGELYSWLSTHVPTPWPDWAAVVREPGRTLHMWGLHMCKHRRRGWRREKARLGTAAGQREMRLHDDD